MKKTLTLKPHQINAVKSLCIKRKSMLASDMGSGKTVIALTALYRIKAFPALVIAPKQVAVNTWPRELNKWKEFENLSYALCVGTREKREAAFKTNSDIYIINIENVLWLYRNYHMPFKTVIIDESSLFKSSSTKRFRELKKAIRSVPVTWLLTGTPISQNLMNIWSQIHLIDTDYHLPRYKHGFKTLYFSLKPYGKFMWENSWEPKIGAVENIVRRISPLLVKVDYNNPEEATVTNQLISLPIRAPYNRLKNDKRHSAAQKLNVLRQFTSGFQYVNGKKVNINEYKLMRLKEILSELHGERIILVYNYIAERENLLSCVNSSFHIHDDNLLESWIHGSGKKKILLTHPASCGYGLNLQYHCNHIIWFSLTWSLELYLQLNARIARTGQTKTPYVHRLLINNTVDTMAAKALDNKKEVLDFFLQTAGEL